MPLNSVNQLSQLIKSSIYIIKKLVSEASSTGFIPICITLVAPLISWAFSFLQNISAVYTLEHICALRAIAATRAQGCLTALFTGADSSSNSCCGAGSSMIQLMVILLLVPIDQPWQFALEAPVRGWRGHHQTAEVGRGTYSHKPCMCNMVSISN